MKLTKAQIEKGESVMDKFWMVYLMAGHNPTIRHATYEKAMAEAKRLNESTGTSAFVLEAIVQVDCKKHIEFSERKLVYVDDTAQRLEKVIRDQLGFTAGEAINGSDTATDLGADSLDIVEIQMAIEEEFDFCFENDEEDHDHTFDEMVKLIKRKLKL